MKFAAGEFGNLTREVETKTLKSVSQLPKFRSSVNFIVFLQLPNYQIKILFLELYPILELPTSKAAKIKVAIETNSNWMANSNWIMRMANPNTNWMANSNHNQTYLPSPLGHLYSPLHQPFIFLCHRKFTAY